MKLYIPYSDYYDEKFLYFIAQQLRKQILGSFNLKKSIQINLELTNRFNENLSFFKIIQSALNNLIMIKTKDGYCIQINPNIKFLNTEIKLIDLVNIGTYGTLNVKGYPIILDAFNDIINNLDYYERYYEACHGIGV